MKKIILLLVVAPLIMAASIHKYYLSVTDLNYNEEAQSIQIITRLFYDDLEAVIQERYDTDVVVDAVSDQEELDKYLVKYFQKKMLITVNGEQREMNFVGKKYEDDYVVCYLEVLDVTAINTFEIESTLLMDVFPDQKNMVHTTIAGKKKSFLLTTANAKGLLNFTK
ncbi:DUF6702 family protein [uncultured Dokdonia sp.]|uniref:DUF6702 family protein n=1 Tax=uncultured Dokdonia sp. TaxID=575653 RepID=UPI0030EF4C0B|tara:strand:+ start:5509 stop:6009 length:501 start_codon:yes stop_codon:yes gene_type:complete